VVPEFQSILKLSMNSIQNLNLIETTGNQLSVNARASNGLLSGDFQIGTIDSDRQQVFE
jgi:hypothetical protein